MSQDGSLKRSVIDAIKTLSSNYPEAEIEAFIEHDMDDPDHSIPVMRVKISYDSVDEYMEVKEGVRSIVRDAEVGETMIYTRIERI